MNFKSTSRIYIDMDGVLADFEKAAELHGLDPKEFKMLPGAYRHLEWMPGAEKALDYLLANGANVWIATKIPHENPLSATEKLQWWQDRRPDMLKRVIITPDKGTLGNEHDMLVDDRPHKAHCEHFLGTFIHFGSDKFPTWDAVIVYLEQHPEWKNAVNPAATPDATDSDPLGY